MRDCPLSALIADLPLCMAKIRVKRTALYNTHYDSFCQYFCSLFCYYKAHFSRLPFADNYIQSRYTVIAFTIQLIEATT